MNISKRKTVFWFTYGNYEIPQSDKWSNEEIHGNSIGERVESVLKRLKEGNIWRYVVITDTKNDEELEILNRNFISNNILKIEDGVDKDKIFKQVDWILREDDNMNNVFFISDTHFNHSNIIKYCNRPWHDENSQTGDIIVRPEDVEKMNEEMIKRWNGVVGKDDIVWHLGDFCLGKDQNNTIPEMVSRLNGKINLVLGNHDHHSVRFYYEAGFNRVYDRKVIINDFVVLSHAPMEFVKAPFFNVFGHVHDCETYKTWSKDSCCVCVERHDYTPVPWIEIEKKYKELNEDS